MFAKKSVVLMALLAGAFAADSIRNRLGQLNSKTLAQETLKADGGEDCGCDDWAVGELPAVELPECPCNFSQLPGLGAG